jgi:hypothetical protein
MRTTWFGVRKQVGTQHSPSEPEFAKGAIDAHGVFGAYPDPNIESLVALIMTVDTYRVPADQVRDRKPGAVDLKVPVVFV